jgi:hypothetical protein
LNVGKFLFVLHRKFDFWINGQIQVKHELKELILFREGCNLLNFLLIMLVDFLDIGKKSLFVLFSEPLMYIKFISELLAFVLRI